MSSFDDKLREALMQMWNASLDYSLSEDLQEVEDRDALYMTYSSNMIKKLLPVIKQAIRESRPEKDDESKGTYFEAWNDALDEWSERMGLW